MIPYTSFAYFAVSLVLLLPPMIAGLVGKRLQAYNFVLTLVFLGITFASSREQLLFLLGYTVWQWLLLRGQMLLTGKASGRRLRFAIIALSLLPLVADKIVAVSSPSQTFAFLGISYMTFKCLQLLFEVSDGQIKEVPIWRFLSFVWFFPTIASGPIDRYRRYWNDAETGLAPAEYRALLYEGVHRIFRGFLYKFIVAYLIKTYVLSLPVVQEHSFAGICAYMYAYSFYLFFDFAGYSAFAIGFSYLLGIRTPENFRLPFLSRNMKDFWNRWHITLSHWFRDFVFMRLTLLLARSKAVKSRFALSSAGYAALFILMGFWHGFELHYIVYGLYHAVMMIGCDGFERLNKRYGFWNSRHPAATIVSTFVTFHVVCFGFLIFSGKLF